MRKKRAFNITCGTVLAGSLPSFFSYTELAKADNPGALSDVASTSEILSKSFKIIKVPVIITVVASLGVFFVYKIFQMRIISYLQKFINDYDASGIGEKFEELTKKDEERSKKLQRLMDEKTVRLDLLITVKKTDLKKLKEIFKKVEEIANDIWSSKGYNQKANEMGLGSDFLNTEKLTVLGEEIIFKKDEGLVPRLLKVLRFIMENRDKLSKKDSEDFLSVGIFDIEVFIRDFFENENFKKIKKKAAPGKYYYFCCVLEVIEKEIKENKSKKTREEELERNKEKYKKIEEEIQKLREADPEYIAALRNIAYNYNLAKNIIKDGNVKGLNVFTNYSEYMGLREDFDRFCNNENPA